MTHKKKLKKVKRSFCVRESIFQRPVHVFLNLSYEEYQEWQKKFAPEATDLDLGDNPNYQAFSTEITGGGKPTEWIIFLREFDWTLNNQGSLIHEIVHTIIKIWKENNIPFNSDTQEFLAQSVSNLYEDIGKELFYPSPKRSNTN